MTQKESNAEVVNDPLADDEAADEAEEFQDPTETVVMSETDFDSASDASAEINVEALVAKVEAEADADIERKKEVRRRLEELAESKGFEDTYAIDFDD